MHDPEMIDALPEFSLDSLFQLHPLHMWLVDALTLDILKGNQAASLAYGHALEEWPRMNLLDLCVSERLPLLEVFRQQPASAGGKEFVFLRKDQSAVTVDLSWQVFKNGQILIFARPVVKDPLHVLSPLERMTELSRMIRAEHGLEALQSLTQEVKQRMHEALQAAEVGIWEWDLISGKVMWDQQTADLMGIALEAFDGTIEGFNVLVHPEDVDAVGEALERSKQAHLPFEKPFRVNGQDGRERWLLSRGRYEYTPEGMPYRVTGVILDITARMQAEHALRDSEKRLRELSESQKRFIADAAHELRTPLTAIQGNLDIFMRYPNIPEDEKLDILSDVQREATRLGRLVNDMLQLARGDSGATLREEEVQLSRLVMEIWRDLGRVVPLHHMVLEEVEEVSLMGDADRLKQLLWILIENSLKYTPEGGTISVSVVQKDRCAELRVSDTGHGISEEDLPRVFERFYRADRSRQRGEDPGGTGLGLPIAKWIVEGHKGKIWLESELGKGTVAVVQLPIQEP
ncbi:ATP-binding protein [Deinococcus misasensis]|uniref:ATP-binding protein n=1 Tax=Deinococcus misasensis TaxID=392413 RepID=UPI00068CAFDA|nr:ATP-binding protein [Deinococcus misasensis]